MSEPKERTPKVSEEEELRILTGGTREEQLAIFARHLEDELTTLQEKLGKLPGREEAVHSTRYVDMDFGSPMIGEPSPLAEAAYDEHVLPKIEELQRQIEENRSLLNDIPDDHLFHQKDGHITSALNDWKEERIKELS